MKRHLIIITLLAFSSSAFSQNILITDADLDTLNPMLCAGAALPNFFDSGNPGNYNPNENETIVICPDYTSGTSKLSLTFGINSGLLFDVDGSDTVFVYDGFSTAAPLLGIHNSVTDPNGFNHVASFNNPKGCLTVQFISDGAIATEGTGWEASVACVAPAQPFDIHMAGYLNGIDIITPLDTGYADVCFGDSILFVASPNFPYSSDITSIGYSQNTSNITYQWDFSDGTTSTNDSVWFTPPARSGYVASLKITDQFPFSQTIISKVRVSTIPSFSGVLITRDSICTGDTTVIIGAVTASDTAGVDPTTSSFQLGGSVAGQVYLPDGSGVSYHDTINISGFVPGDTVTSITDLQQLCLNMEHSFLGDLEMQLTCPNGSIITIFNSNSPGIIPGGFNGGGTYLGHPIDDASGPPGVGEEYCWSSTLNTYGDFPTEFAASNFVALTTPSSPSAGNSMNWNGIYAPEESFINLVGCPLNGDWSITVRDNLGIDDGYIFEWSILFDPLLNPNNETYVPSIVSSQWLSAATILPGLPTDTFIVVSSNSAGTHSYTFQVTDNFGCVYDTTVSIEFIAPPTISISGSGTECDREYQAAGTTSYAGGNWTFSGPGTATFSPTSDVENPLVSVDVNGTYDLTFTDTQCNLDTTITIYFADSIAPFSLSDKDFCVGDEAILETSSSVAEASYLWNTGEISPSIIVTDSGTYYVTVSGLCNSESDSALVVTQICDLTAATIVTPNGDGQNDFLVIDGIEFYPGSSLVVFDRWGKKIYESDDYKNDWSPTGSSAGTYFYVFNPGGVLEADIIPTSFTIFK